MLYADPALNHSYGNLAGGITGLPRNVSPAGEKDYDEDYASGSQRAFSRLSTSKRETNGLPLYTQKVDPPRTGPHKSTSSHTPLQSQVNLLLHNVSPHPDGCEGATLETATCAGNRAAKAR
jgi:hypothetical protein